MKRTRGSRLFTLAGNIVIIAILSAMGMVAGAEAQKASHTPPPPPKQPLNLRPGNGSSTDHAPSGFTPYALGWNYVHATNCYMYDSDGYTYLILYPAEGGTFWTSSAPYQNLLLTACQTGNLIAIYEYDYYGDWSALYTYNYQ